jgi:outer membrane protein assembly factor BamE (lipoprotein component of BamABCDE complex)
MFIDNSMSMKKVLISAVISIPLFCAGCLYIPNLSHDSGHRALDEKTLSSIKEGVTSKEDILMMLGEPDRVMEKERLFQYWWLEVCGYVVVLRDVSTVERTHSLLIYFDKNNVVRKVEIKTSGKFLGTGFNTAFNITDECLLELYAGNYVEMEVPSTSEIDLKENGKGVWKTLGKETPFKWSIGDNEIKLKIKPGPVIVQIEDNILEILQPLDLKGKRFKRVIDSDSR